MYSKKCSFGKFSGKRSTASIGKVALSALGAAGAFALAVGAAQASSHSDAPLIKQDPQANLTDVFTFVGPSTQGPTTANPTGNVLNVVINVRPFCEPGDGAIYDRFADDAAYRIDIADGMGNERLRYEFLFSPVSATNFGFGAGNYKNLDTILSYGQGTTVGPIQTIGDSNQNYTQSYTVRRLYPFTSTLLTTGTSLASGTAGSQSPFLVPPPNVGQKTTPLYNDASGVAMSGATTLTGLDPYTKQAVYNVSSGETVFAGMRDDAFFTDAPGIFDTLNSRILGASPNTTGLPGIGQTGLGTDGFKGYNVLTYGVQIPMNIVQSANIGTLPTVGVFATVARFRTQLRPTAASPFTARSSQMVQVNRLANPLFNEALVAYRDKDYYNLTSPAQDSTNFLKYALNPIPGVLLNAVYNLGIPVTNRTDLAALLIPDVIRVDTSTPPVPLAGQPGFNRLSFAGGDLVRNAAGTYVPGGFPNGRRFGDDTTDIELTAIANMNVATPTSTDGTGKPVFGNLKVPVGDNINANDQVFNMVFPFAATPNSGTNNRKDPQPGAFMNTRNSLGPNGV